MARSRPGITPVVRLPCLLPLTPTSTRRSCATPSWTCTTTRRTCTGSPPHSVRPFLSPIYLQEKYPDSRRCPNTRAEDAVIDTLAAFNVPAGRSDVNTGVWVRPPRAPLRPLHTLSM